MLIDFLNSWKELIIAFLKNYPIAGAILGALAIYTYFELKRRKVNGNKPILNILIAFGGWVILVPVVGLIFNIIGKIWSYIETTMPFLVGIVSKIGQIYEKHPFLVLSVVVIGFFSYFIWSKWWKEKIKWTWLKILIIISAVILVIFISSPIADLFTVDKSKKNNDRQNVADSIEDKVEPQTDITIVKENLYDSISEFNKTWMYSYLVRDSIGILQNCTDSTLCLFPSHQVMIGKDSLLSYWLTKRNSGFEQVQIKITNVVTEDICNLAIENGTYNFISDSGKVVDSGEYFRIWKKLGVRWIKQKDIWYNK